MRSLRSRHSQPGLKEDSAEKHSLLRRRMLSLAAALLAVGSLSLGSSTPALADDSSCLSNNFVCVWNQPGYQGAKLTIGAEQALEWRFFDNNKYSIKNHFFNRAVYTWYTPYGWAGLRCFNPGDKTSTWFIANALYIDAPGSRC